METYLDTLCAGWPVFTEDPEFPASFECVGTATGTVVEVTCGDTWEAEGCTAIATIEINAIRSGDSFTATNITNIEFEGAAPSAV